MNPLTCYIEFSLKPFVINRSLNQNFITGILTEKGTWNFLQVPKVLKKENQYTYYHSALKYESFILRIKKRYFAGNLHKKPETEHLFYYIDYYKRTWVALLMILANYSQDK